MSESRFIIKGKYLKFKSKEVKLLNSSLNFALALPVFLAISLKF